MLGAQIGALRRWRTPEGVGPGRRSLGHGVNVSSKGIVGSWRLPQGHTHQELPYHGLKAILSQINLFSW